MAVSSVHKQMHCRTQQNDEKGQELEKVRPMFHQQKIGDCPD
jgi:hypothetical protein